MKPLVKNILTLFIALIVALVAVEVALNVIAAREQHIIGSFEYAPKPDGSILKTKKNDFRKKYPKAGSKTDETIRILALGDSYTWGSRISRYDDIWTAVLERDLLAVYPDKRIEVVNLGIKGFTTINEMELLSHTYKTLQPDVVIVQFTLNDPLPSGQNFQHANEEDIPQNIKTLLGPVGKLFGNSKLYLLLNKRYKAFQYKISGKTLYDPLYENNFSGWLACQKALMNISKISASQNAPCVMMIFPRFNSGKWTLDTYPYRKLHEKVLKAGGRAGMYVLDLYPEFVSQNKDFREWCALEGLDGHPNIAAHEFAATVLSEFLVENNLVVSRQVRQNKDV